MALDDIEHHLDKFLLDVGYTDGSKAAANTMFNATRAAFYDALYKNNDWTTSNASIQAMVGAVNTPPAAGGSGAAIVTAARQLMASGYHYTAGLSGASFNFERFKVGCCADFAVDTWAKAGEDLFKKLDNPHLAPNLMKYMQATGKFTVPEGPANPGDMVFFRWGGDEAWACSHVGIVTEVNARGICTRVIESHSMNQPVHERPVTAGKAASIVGYGRP